jgi:hypothetical protein
VHERQSPRPHRRTPESQRVLFVADTPQRRPLACPSATSDQGSARGISTEQKLRELFEAIVVEPRAIMTPTRFLTVIPCHVSSDFSVGSAHSDCSAQAIAVGVRWRGGGRKGRPRSTYLIADRRLRTCIRQLFQNRLRCGSIPTMRLHHHCERTQILTARSLRRLVWARSASRPKVWRVVANCALWLERRFPPPER